MKEDINENSINMISKILAWVLIICALSNIFIFMPTLPQVFYYGIMILLNILLLVTNMGKPISVSVGMWLFWLIMWLSILVNHDTLPAIFQAEERTVAFFGVISVLGPWLLCKRLVNLRLYIWENLNKCLFFMIMLSFFGKIGGFLPSDRQGYYLGCFGHSMILAPLAGIVCLNCLHKSVSLTELAKQRFYGICAVAAFAVLLFSSSRTSLVAVVLSAAVYFIYQFNNKAGTIVRNVMLFCVVLGIISLTIGGLLSGIESKQSDSVGIENVLASRQDSWTARLNEIKESPVFGIGSHSVKLEYTDNSGQVEPGNAWLYAWSSMGFFAFLALLAIVGCAFFQLRADILLNKRPESVLLISQVFFFALYMNGEAHITAAGDFTYLYFWLIIGISLGIQKYLPAGEKNETEAVLTEPEKA